MNSFKYLIKHEWALILMIVILSSIALSNFVSTPISKDLGYENFTTRDESLTSSNTSEMFTREKRTERSTMIQQSAKEVLQSGKIPRILQTAVSVAFICFVIGTGLWMTTFSTKKIPNILITNSLHSNRRLPIQISDIFAVVIAVLFFDILVSSLDPFFNSILRKLLSTSTQGASLFLLTLLRSMLVFVYIRHRIFIKRGLTLKDVGFSSLNILPQIRNGFIAYCMVLPIYVLSALAISTLFSLIGKQIPVQMPIEAIYGEQHQGVLIFVALFVGAIGPFFEEYVFRGVIYSSLRTHASKYIATGLSSIIFAGFHAHLAAFIPILVLSLALNYLYERTGSLIACGTLHATHNLIMLLFVFGIKGIL